MFDASMAPSAPPAPTTVWISSMKRMISPFAASTSSMTAFRRSSNSPRNLDPATSPGMSSHRTRFCLMASGTPPAAMACARPSTTAVLPTPASPSSTGLFLVRRDSVWMACRTTPSRATTGSRRPSRASCVRSRLNFSSDRYRLSALGSVTRCAPRTLLSA